MKISKLYSNKPDQFEQIEFVSGLNVVLAEIHRPENRNKDTHNLGKTILGRLIDFGFLSSRDPSFFLFKHFDLFKDFVFYLEIQLLDGSFLTLRRSVSEASKICFKKHTEKYQDYTDLSESDWDHYNIPFERARAMLDSLLDFQALKPWPYRKGMGYLIRSQEDFREVFHISKFAAAHSDWKPFLAQILGFDAELISKHYQTEELLSKTQETESTIKRELGGSIEDISKIEGLLLLKKKDSEKKQHFLDAFDFRVEDKNTIRELVDDINIRISQLNEEKYSLNQNQKKLLHR